MTAASKAPGTLTLGIGRPDAPRPPTVPYGAVWGHPRPTRDNSGAVWCRPTTGAALTTTEPDQDVTPALGAALANPNDPILLPPDEWAVVLQMARMPGGCRVLTAATAAAIAEAVAGEKERITRVAEELGAHYHDGGKPASFADYLRGARS